METPKVVVARTIGGFVNICRRYGWNRTEVVYVNMREADEKLVGYYEEDVYPEWVAARLSRRERSNTD